MRIKLLDETLHIGGQSVCLTSIFVAVTSDGKTHKLKVFIESDAYKFQSKAVIKRFDGSEWKELATIPYSLMKTPEGLVYKKNPIPTRNNFTFDLDALIQKAKLILE